MNKANKRIIGKGTPRSQSNAPRPKPMIASIGFEINASLPASFLVELEVNRTWRRGRRRGQDVKLHIACKSDVRDSLGARIIIATFRCVAMEKTINRHQVWRRKCALPARMQTPREESMPCVIHSMSSFGATVVATLTDIPREFKLLLSDDGKIFRQCRVVWQRGLKLGIQFTNVPRI